MKIGLYASPLLGLGPDLPAQVQNVRAHGIEYLSALPYMPQDTAGWQAFTAPPANGFAGINFWRLLTQHGLKFSVVYKPAVDNAGVDWQKIAIEMALAEGSPGS